MRHLGDATVVSWTTSIICRIDGITGEGVVSREYDHTDRRFAGEAREAEATDDGRSDREHDARLGREARGDRQGDAAVRVRGEGLEGRKRTAAELDTIVHRTGEGGTKGAVAVSLHRARGDDGITGVGIDARETEEGRDATGAGRTGAAEDRAVLTEVSTRLDEVGGARDDAGQGDAVREASGARVERADRVEGDLRGGGAIEENVAGPGLGAETVITECRTGLQRQRSTEGDDISVGGEDGGVLDGDAVGGGAVDVFEGELTRGHIVHDVRAVGADVDDARADLGQGEAIAVHRAVVTEAFDTTDVKATARAANTGVRRKGDVTDTGVGIVSDTSVGDGTEAADARAGDGEVDVVRTLVSSC